MSDVQRVNVRNLVYAISVQEFRPEKSARQPRGLWERRCFMCFKPKY